MTPTRRQQLARSALATAKRLAELAEERDRLTRTIAASDCYGHEQRDSEGLLLSHLRVYFEVEKRYGYDYDYTGEPGRYDSQGRIAEALDAVRACPACDAALSAIQRRRIVRRRIGAARAALVRIGKLANAEEEA